MYKPKRRCIKYSVSLGSKWISESQAEDFVLINKSEINSHFIDFVVPVDHRVNIKENNKASKYIGISRVKKKMG